MPTIHGRNIRDAAKEVSKALPAANANNASDAIDLEQTQGGLLENIAFEVSVPALPALVDAKTVTLKVQDSANGTDFADLEPGIEMARVGADSAGAAAKDYRFRLPPAARRYVRLYQAVQDAGGDNTGVSVTFRALF